MRGSAGGDEGAGEAEQAAYGIRPAGYRLPPGTRVGAVRLQVASLERSRTFYEGVLGLRTLRHDPRRATLGVPPASAAAATDAPAAAGDVLVELVERPGAAPKPRRGRLGLFHFAVLLPDRAALGRILSHFGQVGVPAGASDHLVSEALYLEDPDGHGIEVYADRPRAEWRARGRELAMDTRPLDTRAVVAAAGDAPWEGAPPGTRIGHVHLHVGDLGEAEAFYHDGLGLDKVVWSYPGALFLSAGGYHHHVGVNTWAGPRAGPPPDEEARLLEWELVVPEGLDGVVASLERAGTVVRRTAAGVLARDPWGTAVAVREP